MGWRGVQRRVSPWTPWAVCLALWIASCGPGAHVQPLHGEGELGWKHLAVRPDVLAENAATGDARALVRALQQGDYAEAWRRLGPTARAGIRAAIDAPADMPGSEVLRRWARSRGLDAGGRVAAVFGLRVVRVEPADRGPANPTARSPARVRVVGEGGTERVCVFAFDGLYWALMECAAGGPSSDRRHSRAAGHDRAPAGLPQTTGEAQ